MKKRISALLASALLLTAASCGDAGQKPPAETTAAASLTETAAVSASETTVPDTGTPAPETDAPAAVKTAPERYRTVLENKMTDCELAMVRKRAFSITDENICDEIIAGRGKSVFTKEMMLANYEKYKEFYPEDIYNEMIESASGSESEAVLVNGIECTDYIPDTGYDGGAFSDGERDYADMQEYFDTLSEMYEEWGYSLSDRVDLVRLVKGAFEALVNGTMTELPPRYASFERLNRYVDPKADYRSKWTLSSANIDYVRDHTDEYLIFDEELATLFTVYVTVPPEYDKDRAYPVLFMTDAVWRLNDHAELYKAMERGEAEDVILVSLGYNYNIDGTDDYVRFMHLIADRRLLLGFVTDNVMPYLCENYSIDCGASTLFGHSMAGVFSHVALLESDKYENQPFGRYIIASPAFWNLYSDYPGIDAESMENDYGYFDRNEALGKSVFLCGGALEDPDYSSQYNGHDSTLTGLEKLRDRLVSHGADVDYKLYDSHHYQYVPDMLVEYLTTVYPR